MQITSRDNSLLRKARAVRDGKDEDLIFVEGLRLCEEAVRSQVEIYAVVVSEELASKDRVKAKIDEITSNSPRTGFVSEKLLASISFTKTPQGIVLLAQRPKTGKSLLLRQLGPNPFLLVLHEINNPVNVGAMVRTAEAGGVSGVITTAKTSDPFSPKALRGAMGSAFRLPLWTDASFKEMLELCRENGLSTVATVVHAGTSYTELDWTSARALILGPESTGLSPEELAETDETITIPMKQPVESLNVSVASAIVIYEAARQRTLQKLLISRHKE